MFYFGNDSLQILDDDLIYKYENNYQITEYSDINFDNFKDKMVNAKINQIIRPFLRLYDFELGDVIFYCYCNGKSKLYLVQNLITYKFELLSDNNVMDAKIKLQFDKYDFRAIDILETIPTIASDLIYEKLVIQNNLYAQLLDFYMRCDIDKILKKMKRYSLRHLYDDFLNSSSSRYLSNRDLESKKRHFEERSTEIEADPLTVDEIKTFCTYVKDLFMKTDYVKMSNWEHQFFIDYGHHLINYELFDKTKISKDKFYTLRLLVDYDESGYISDVVSEYLIIDKPIDFNDIIERSLKFKI